MTQTTFGIIGAGGFGREVLPAARAQYLSADNTSAHRIVFVSEADDVGTTRNGIPVVGLHEFLATPGVRRFNTAIADSVARARIASVCEAAGVGPFTIQAPSAIILDENEIGDGGILCDFTMVTSNAHIGRHFHLNIYSYVAHDCWIGDFVTFAPGVKCNGNVRIEDHAYIGTGAVLRPGQRGKPLVIGQGAVVGMGAVVTRDVPAYTTVAGNPARPLRRSEN